MCHRCGGGRGGWPEQVEQGRDRKHQWRPLQDGAFVDPFPPRGRVGDVRGAGLAGPAGLTRSLAAAAALLCCAGGAADCGLTDLTRRRADPSLSVRSVTVWTTSTASCPPPRAFSPHRRRRSSAGASRPAMVCAWAGPRYRRQGELPCCAGRRPARRQ